MLCEICQLTFQGRTERTYSTAPFAYDHHQSASDVLAAAKEGCHFCTLLWSLLTADECSRVLAYNPDIGDDPQRRIYQVQITSISSESLLQVSFPLSLQGRTYESENFCVKFLGLVPVLVSMLGSFIQGQYLRGLNC